MKIILKIIYINIVKVARIKTVEIFLPQQFYFKWFNPSLPFNFKWKPCFRNLWPKNRGSNDNFPPFGKLAKSTRKRIRNTQKINIRKRATVFKKYPWIRYWKVRQMSTPAETSPHSKSTPLSKKHKRFHWLTFCTTLPVRPTKRQKRDIITGYSF